VIPVICLNLVVKAGEESKAENQFKVYTLEPVEGAKAGLEL